MTKRKILLVSMYSSPDKNGMAVYADKLFKIWKELRFKPLMVTRFLPQRKKKDDIVSVKVPSVKLDDYASLIAKSDPRTYSLKFFQKAAEYVSIETALVHCLVCWDDYLAVWPYFKNEQRKFKIILTIGGGGMRGPENINSLRKEILNQLDAITFLSHRAGQLIDNLGIDKPKKYYTPPSVNLKTFTFKKISGRSRNLTVLYLGRIDKHKGVFDILKIAKNCRGFNFNIIGEGRDKSKLKHQLKMKKINNIRVLEGINHNKVRDEFANADIFLHPTYDDEFPVSLLEAMAAGLPIVSTPIGDIPFIVKPNENGFLCSPGNLPCFLRAMNKLQFLETRQQFSKKGRKIAACYSEKRMKEIYARIKNEIL